MNFIQRYIDSNYSFFNTGSKEKKVLTKWTEFQHRKPTIEEINRWIKSPISNFAIVCGEISNLIVFDVDTKNGGDPTPFQNRGFYEIRTPSGGYHFYVKYNPLLESTKHKRKYSGILNGVDVQSNGSIVFAPPSFFEGKGGYTLVLDAPLLDIPDDLLAQVLEALEPEKKSTDYCPYIPPKNPQFGRPGDIFNSFATWEQVLIPLRWTKVYTTSNDTTYWRRPGKTDGISASTNWKGYDIFIAFTTSVSEIQSLKGYTKFTLLATLKFEGDYGKTAKHLILENYKLIASKL
jgi:hypothetical protein